MKRILKLLYILPIIGGLVGCTNIDAEADKILADTVFINGNIYTVEENNTAESVAVKDGKIVFVGDNKEIEKFKGDSTEVVDLKGQTMLPGFVDSHNHAGNTVELLFGADLSVGEGFDDYIEIMQKYYDEHKDDDYIYGAGWINPYMTGVENPKEALDKISSDKPIILASEDRHTLWLNSKGLEIAGVNKDSKDPEGGTIGRLPNNEPNGLLYEASMSNAIEKLPSFTKDQFKESIIAFEKMALEKGVTQINQVITYYQDQITEALVELDKEGNLNLDYYVSYTIFPHEGIEKIDKIKELKGKLNGENIKFNSVKLFDDGVIEGETAYLLDDYNNKAGYKGYSVWDKQEYFDIIKALDKEGIQVHVHAVGDAAVKNTLDALEAAQTENKSSNTRHKITHLQLVRDEDIKRMKDLNVTAILQPVWAYKEESYYKQTVDLVGEERAASQYPLNSFFENGVIVSASTDYPVTLNISPFLGLEVGVTRKEPGSIDEKTALNPEEATSLENMLKSYTINGAYTNFAEDTSGSIKESKEADFVIVDKDIFKVKTNEIHKTQVLKTYNDGKIVFENK